ncbi:MAG TPA: asparagine synthase (glutamine-hydrolyzing) [Methylomirabilota bacterium]|nr:asparagine synthase (glutamine-hydrolyzing) [Methylomirabilota bacterium]
MCGIAGFVQRARAEADLGAVGRRLTDAMTSRGPDGSGLWTERHGDWDVVLGHRRLAIIDLVTGDQPLHSAAGALHVTFNGEIFNFRELRADLKAGGTTFRTRSDTEVIAEHFAASGTDGLPALNGMFAFAAWDSRRGRLTLARDRAGIKPLYYCRLPGGGLAFASELTALLRHPDAPRGLDRAAMRDYFFADAIHPPRTAIEGVCKLPPGHWLDWEDGRLSVSRAFWRLAPPSSPATPDEEPARERLRALLQASVRRTLIADVPIGVFLSGGVDSSLVAALAAREVSGPLHTFSIAFEEPDFDESPYARRVAASLGTRHTEDTVSERTLLASLDAALGALDEPMADPSILPTWALARLAAGHVKVALGGDGGDELWAGYPTYRAHRLAGVYARVPALVRRRVVEPAVARLPVRPTYQSFEWKAKHFVLRHDADAVRRHLRWMSNTDLADLRALFGGDAAEPALLAREAGAADGWRDPLNAMLALDFRTYLPDSVLTKVDRASMAHGLEVRPPLLDNALIDLAFALPGRFKLRGGRSKRLLKEVAAAYLPRAIVERPKRGFAIPLARWLRGPLRERVAALVASTGPLWTDTGLSRAVVAAWAHEHQRGVRDRAKPLWALLVLDRWLRRLAEAS